MRKFLIFALLIIICAACAPKEKPLIIALSKGAGSESYEKYEKWLKSTNPNIECIDLFFIDKDEALKVLERADGVVLTGGPDVHPFHYGKDFDTSRCEIDLVRDTLEFEIIRIARSKGIPMLAVCRGAQIINVAFGGTLIVDIPEDTDSEVIHQVEEGDAMHEIIIEDSYLSKISGVRTAYVNSNHHQAVDALAAGLKATARTADGIVEAFEYTDQKSNFMIAVQWHPERMDKSDTLSASIAKEFLHHSEKFRQAKSLTK
ncbi:MAG: hypothetical protein CVV22_08785 [Ignavibacteriae bacterium HGW-Ignavibacteriae-1]|jgi:putative glutamine amidotransferase|nr:MAG: hypothetical protein CVV22_08785 [Ignavibacteriae bacterium HGW-Ignavibacteriae-1]